MYMGESAQITNGMLYEMIKSIKDELRSFKDELRDFKEDFRSFKTDITARQTEDHQMIMGLWKERGEIKVRFSRFQFAVVASLSFVVSLTVAVFVVAMGG